MKYKELVCDELQEPEDSSQETGAENRKPRVL
jgi:hypothetical protein